MNEDLMARIRNEDLYERIMAPEDCIKFFKMVRVWVGPVLPL